jgi:hypothetical protein
VPTTHGDDPVRLLHPKHLERIEQTLAGARECSAEDPRALTYFMDVSTLLSHIAAQDQRYAALVAAGKRMRHTLGHEWGHPKDTRAANEFTPDCSMCQWDEALAALAQPPGDESRG